MDNGSYSKTHNTQSKKLGTTGHQRFEIFIWSSSIPFFATFFKNIFQTSPKIMGFCLFPPVAAPRCQPRENPKVLHWPPTTPTMRQQPQWQQRRRRFFDALGKFGSRVDLEMFFVVGLKRGNPKVSWLRSADDLWKIVTDQWYVLAGRIWYFYYYGLWLHHMNHMHDYAIINQISLLIAKIS